MKFNKLLKKIENKHIITKLPSIKIGDTVKIGLVIQEGNKQRIQPYEGTIIAQHKSGISTTITVRRIFQNIGVERVFFLHSPLIQNIELIRRARIRKSKLYFLRTRVGKKTKLKEQFN